MRSTQARRGSGIEATWRGRPGILVESKLVRYPEAGSAPVDGAGMIRRHVEGRQRALMVL